MNRRISIMAELDKNQNPAAAGDQAEPGTTDFDLRNELEKLKANTVPKEQYEESQNQLKQMWDLYANGSKATDDTESETPVDIPKLKHELFDTELSNLEYATKALELRKAVMDNGGQDPFLPSGHNVIPTDQDIAAANRVAEALQNCVDQADGDSAIFTNELQRIMVDTAPIRRKK